FPARTSIASHRIVQRWRRQRDVSQTRKQPSQSSRLHTPRNKNDGRLSSAELEIDELRTFEHTHDNDSCKRQRRGRSLPMCLPCGEMIHRFVLPLEKHGESTKKNHRPCQRGHTSDRPVEHCPQVTCNYQDLIEPARNGSGPEKQPADASDMEEQHAEQEIFQGGSESAPTCFCRRIARLCAHPAGDALPGAMNREQHSVIKPPQ